jgi:NADH:ubiquinone oxidoreductase subunit 5 (subunit L)/multisubunit Na+/H+ antiporter MnhA subunit
VKNAMKVFSVYRIGDLGLILAMWMSHHLWHENVTFAKLNNYELVHHHLMEHSFIGIAITCMILLAAVAKSAQLPFSSWLPRAMEGPTPSSAIFYASLSVHIGAFILLRTFPFWEQQTVMRVLIICLRLSTSIVASFIGRVQSSIKTQVAYSSISQIGLIFVEIALGLDNLALFHFAGNAFLRTYQLLVSPSVVSYLIRQQFFTFKPREETMEDNLPRKIQHAFYILALKEFNLDYFMYRFFWSPIKWVGKQFRFLNFRMAFTLFVPVFAFGVFALYTDEAYVPAALHEYLPEIFSFMGIVLGIKAFTERKHVMEAWFYILLNHCWIALAISFNEHFNADHIFLYLSGIGAAGLIGLLMLNYLRKRETHFDLNNFHGHAFEYPKLAFGFLLAALGMSGFPITPSFIGEDLIFSHIHSDQIALVLINSMSFVITGLAIIRIYARLFLGPHSKNYSHMPLRSS